MLVLLAQLDHLRMSACPARPLLVHATHLANEHVPPDDEAAIHKRLPALVGDLHSLPSQQRLMLASLQRRHGLGRPSQHMVLEHIRDSSCSRARASTQVELCCDEGAVAGDKHGVVKAGGGVEGGVQAGNGRSRAELGQGEGVRVAQGCEAWVVAICGQHVQTARWQQHPFWLERWKQILCKHNSRS
jgi:hypothetical protein